MNTFKLRLWIPLLVLISSNLVIVVMILFQTALLSKNQKHESLARVQQLMSQLQRSVEENLLHQHMNKIEQEISALGTVPEISTLTLVDHQGIVTYALRYAWKKQPIGQVDGHFDERIYRQVIADRHFRIHYLTDKRAIQAYYPIRLPSTNKQIRSSEYGILYIHYDLTHLFATIWYNTLIESGLLWIICFLLMLFLVYILTKLVTRPVSYLVSLMQQYSQDERTISCELSGTGELAVLGKSFCQLTCRLNESRDALIQQKNLYNTLSKTNQLITRVKDPHALFKETCQIIVDHGGFVLAWIGLIENDGVTAKIFASAGPAKELFHQQAQIFPLYSANNIQNIIDTEGYIIIDDYQNAPLTAPQHEFARRVNIASSAAFALKRFDRVIAILKIYADRKHYFSDAIVSLLRSMSEDISYALNNLKLAEIRQQAENDLREREENLAITLNSIGDAVITTDSQGLITRMNPIAEKLTGWDSTSASGRLLNEVFNIINTLTGKPAENPVDKVLQQGRIVGLANHTSLRGKQGAEYQIADSAAPITNREGKTIGVILVFHDVTEQYKIHAKQQENAQRFRHASEVSGAYVWELDNQYRYNYITDLVSRVKGYTPEQLLGHQPFEFMAAEDVEPSRQIIREAVANQGCFTLTHRNITPDGTVLWEEVKGQALIDEQGQVYKIRGAGVSINERKQAEAEIKQLAYYDPLTDLPNRRMIIDRLEHELAAAKRHHYIGAILFFDLDHFKNLNDSLGHNAGDELLIQIARRLEQQLRNEDTAARLGGDEFVVLLNNISSNQSNAIDKVRKVTEKIQRILLDTYFLDGHEYHLSLSIGITLFPQAGQDVNDLLKQADTALYRAKAQGRNHYQFFRQEMQEAAHHRLQMEKELHVALATDQMRLHYQPQFNEQGRVTGAEALLRWLHPEKGYIPPDRFIPVAEECGLILRLGHWVLQTALEHMERWLQSQAMTPGQTLSVNISPKQFKQDAFVRETASVIQQYQLPPETLILEITENLLLTDIDETINKMQQLKKLGVSFSIDDFGTGYSSLAYLKRLPLSELKIDKTFIKDISIDNNDQVIIETIIAMARHMKLHVIAEGVETSDQIEFLKRQGCRHYQGYYFSKPLNQQAFTSFLHEHR